METQDSALTILEYNASFFPLRENLSHPGLYTVWVTACPKWGLGNSNLILVQILGFSYWMGMSWYIRIMTTWLSTLLTESPYGSSHGPKGRI